MAAPSNFYLTERKALVKCRINVKYGLLSVQLDLKVVIKGKHYFQHSDIFISNN